MPLAQTDNSSLGAGACSFRSGTALIVSHVSIARHDEV